jgi:hemoglobin/transferrin/lactoferrin receptor protein
MKKHISLLLCMGAWLASYCQTITIRDVENRQALEGVTLASNEPSAFAVTDALGQADLSPFKGSVQIEMRRVGYSTQIKSYEELSMDGGDGLLLKPVQVALGEVVISATRWSQSSKDVPFKIATIGPKDVALQNPQTTADLLGTSGQVFIQKSQQGGGSPMIRGFATNRLLIAVDGVRMNTAIFRSGNLQNVISLDPFSLENTEVLFGPGSVIYGSDAIAGVMNFSTLRPKLASESASFVTGNAALRYSSANHEMTAHLHLNAAWKKWALTTSFTHSDFGDLRMGTNGPDEYLRKYYVQRLDGKDMVFMNEDPLVQRPSGYQQINLMQKLRYQPNANWDITYGFHYSSTTDFSRYDRLLRFKEGLPRSAEWMYGPQEWIMNNLAVSHKRQNGIYDELNIRLAHQFFEESRMDRDFNDPLRRTRLEKVNAWSLNLDFHKGIGQKHKLFYGLEGIYDDVSSSGTDENLDTGEKMLGPARYPQSNWASYAAYLAWQFKATQKLTLHGGARYNGFSLNADFDTSFYPFPYTSASLNNAALTGNLGLVFHPDQYWGLRFNLSSGFRAPNVDDMGKVFDSEPGAVIVPNPSLRAEYAWNAEVGIERAFGEVLKLDLTGFYTVLENALVRRDFSLNGQDSISYDGELSRVQAIQNAAMAKVWGIQAGLEVKLMEGFGLSSNLTWQKGEEELDNGTLDPLRHAAPLFGITRLSYTADKLRMEAYLAYSGEVGSDNLAAEERAKDYMYALDKNGDPYSPNWWTLNFKAMYQLSELWAVSGGVENISDQRYRPYSSGLVAPGRNFILSLRASF